MAQAGRLRNKKLFLDILEDLGHEEFEKFKWYLKDNGVTKSELEKANRMETVDKIIQTQGRGSMEVIKQLLKSIGRNDLEERLPNSTGRPEPTSSSQHKDDGVPCQDTKEIQTSPPSGQLLIQASPNCRQKSSANPACTSQWPVKRKRTNPPAHNEVFPVGTIGTRGQIINNEALRIVLVGKTGVGKSASGNTILGQECFESKFCAKSMTVDCSKGRGTVDGQKIAVIDTPGLFDTRNDEEKTTRDLSQCIKYASPGPHVFLVVIRLGRYREEEMKTVQKIEEIFGQAADKYSMVLFTHGDLLKDTIEDFLSESPELQELVARCNSQYHVFNNRSKDQSQVTKLLQKIRDIVKKNGGNHYTNKMFQEAERALEEEKQRILKENEDEIRKEREELEKSVREQLEIEMNKLKEQFKAEGEKRERGGEGERAARGKTEKDDGGPSGATGSRDGQAAR